jgi:hypothetical protein
MGKTPDQEFIETPRWCVDILLLHACIDYLEPILDPCAGRGAILAAMKVRAYDGEELHGIEVSTARALHLSKVTRHVVCADYFSTQHHAKQIIMNPPYSIARRFVEKARSDADLVCVLLPLRYLGLVGWRPMMEDLSHLIVLPKRPFGCERECAWFIWSHHMYCCTPAVDFAKMPEGQDDNNA